MRIKRFLLGAALLLGAVAVAALMVWLGYDEYETLARWEREGGGHMFHSGTRMLYDLGGKNAVAGSSFLVAVLILGWGVRTVFGRPRETAAS